MLLILESNVKMVLGCSPDGLTYQDNIRYCLHEEALGLAKRTNFLSYTGASGTLISYTYEPLTLNGVCNLYCTEWRCEESRSGH